MRQYTQRHVLPASSRCMCPASRSQIAFYHAVDGLHLPTLAVGLFAFTLCKAMPHHAAVTARWRTGTRTAGRGGNQSTHPHIHSRQTMIELRFVPRNSRHDGFASMQKRPKCRIRWAPATELAMSLWYRLLPLVERQGLF